MCSRIMTLCYSLQSAVLDNCFSCLPKACSDYGPPLNHAIGLLVNTDLLLMFLHLGQKNPYDFKLRADWLGSSSSEEDLGS